MSAMFGRVFRIIQLLFPLKSSAQYQFLNVEVDTAVVMSVLKY